MHVSIEEFNCALWKRYQSGKIRNVYPLVKYNDIIDKIKMMAKNPPCNMPGEYYLLRKFVVVNVGGKERLSCKPEFLDFCKAKGGHSSKTKFYVALEEIYGYLDDAHRCLKHGGRDKIFRKIQSQGVVNITRETAELFLSFCTYCRPKIKEHLKKTRKQSAWDILRARSCDSPPANISSENLSNSPLSESMLIEDPETDILKVPPSQNQPVCTFTRSFIDLIDSKSNPDGDYRFILVYIDIRTCFCILHPIKCKCNFEVASQLLNIFSLIGTPDVLHSNLEEQFVTEVIQELKLAWKDIVIVQGANKYAELQNVAENCVSDIRSMLKSWMVQNSSNNWSFGLRTVQLQKNTKLPSSGLKSPFECFFGRTEKPLNFPPHISHSVLKSVRTEDELLAIINASCSPKIAEVQSFEQLQVSLDPDICNLVQKQNEDESEFSENENESLPVIKVECMSDDELPHMNGFSDSSNDASSKDDIQTVIKQEEDDS